MDQVSLAWRPRTSIWHGGITEIAADEHLVANGRGQDRTRPRHRIPCDDRMVWAALLTGIAAQGDGILQRRDRRSSGQIRIRGSVVDDDEAPRRRFHVEVDVAPEVAEQRVAAAVAAGGTVVDEHQLARADRHRRSGRNTESVRRDLLSETCTTLSCCASRYPGPASASIECPIFASLPRPRTRPEPACCCTSLATDRDTREHHAQ